MIKRVPDGMGGFKEEITQDGYVGVLGTLYSMKVEPEIPYDGADAFTDPTSKEIYVYDYSDMKGKPDSKKNLDSQVNKNKRHEIIHAFLCESGLAENSDWAQNEEMVDWIAIQAPKLIKAWQEAGAL